MIIKEYSIIRFGRNAKVTTTLTRSEYNTICLMATQYGWSEVTALMVYRGYNTDVWNRTIIEYI